MLVDEEDQRVDEDDVGDRGERDEQHDRRAQDVADDHHFLVVPAVDERAGDRAEEQVRERGREEDEPGRERRPGRGGHDRDERELVEPVAEQRDELARPQRRERAVEGEADVWVLADALDRLGRWPRDRDRDGVGRGRGAELEVVEGRRGGEAEARLAPALPMASGRSRATGRPNVGARPVSYALVTRAQRPSSGVAARRALGRRADFLLELRRHANDGGEQEERQAEGQEGIADRGHVLDDRQRDRDDVAERAQVEQEVGIERRRQDVVERRLMSAGSRPASCEGSAPRSACSRR